MKLTNLLMIPFFQKSQLAIVAKVFVASFCELIL